MIKSRRETFRAVCRCMIGLIVLSTAKARCRFSWGGSLSGSHYQEQVIDSPHPFMLERGFLYGLVAQASLEDRRQDKKLVLDTACRGGRLYYRSASGRFRPRDVWAEARLLFWGGRRGRIHPYFGLGYRFLFDDLTVAGSRGYHRFQTYWYIPCGVSITWIKRPHIEWFLEYDEWLEGHNHSAGYVLYQRQGFGIRSGLRSVIGHLRHHGVIIEPFINYWHVQDSEYVEIQENSLMRWVVYEPHNTSMEIGLKLTFGL